PANGLLVLGCDGQVSQPIRFQIESGKDSTTVEFKISKDWIPNFTAYAELTGSIPRVMELTHSPRRPAIVTGSVTVEVSRDIYKLNVLITTKEPNKIYTPSSIMHIDVDIKQYVDNSPVKKQNDDEEGGGGGPMRGKFRSARGAEQKLAVRSNSNPLACWTPSSITDSSGHVSIEVKLPDNLTRYRVWALATNDRQYGLGEMPFSVQLPIMIRPSLPRFLNYGDMAYFSVILQNQTGLSLLLHAGLRASNAKLLTAQTNRPEVGYSIVLPPSKRAALIFPVTTIHSGTARCQFIISTPRNKTSVSFHDAIELSLPVFTPATSEAFATYGDTYEEVVFQPIKSPKNVLSQYGGLSITTSSTALASLTDALISLYTYPDECTEQLSSRLLGIQSLWDVLQAFYCKELPGISILKTKLESDINKLKGRQYPNGGFGYWTNRKDSHADPYMSVHVAHCLAVIANKNVRILFQFSLEFYLRLYYK
ncbi:unnamed protein product, partial [Rotaria sp. Silwood1]